MAKYDGWAFRNKENFFIIWTLRRTQREARETVSNWRDWQRLGFKLVKVKLVEVE